MNEIIDGNVFGPANLARRQPPLPGAEKRGNGNHVHTARARRTRFRPKTGEPFTVRVKRKFNTAKVKLGRKLGLYTENFQFPLGMYVDFLA